jgi:23S rRNA (uracil1939-C5)-methyltransferase
MKLRIEKAVYGGSGLARQTEGSDAGRVAFVPFALPGELVEARLAAKKNGLDEAALLGVIEPSGDRVEPRCGHFVQCGGCQYQHADYAAQLAMKVAILRETLERAGLPALPEIQTHADKAWGYRNRIRLRVAAADGALRVGYNRRGSNEFLPIRECPIAAPLLWRAAVAFNKIGEEQSAAGRWTREAAEVEFFAAGDETKLQMTVFVRKERVGGFGELCERMRAMVPELIGAGVSTLSGEASPRRAQRVRRLQSWGVNGLSYSVAGEGYWVTRSSFFQVNRFLVDELVRVVTGGRAGTLAWDLYAGVGLFSRALARAFEQVVAVEAAGEDLALTFAGAGRRAVSATTVEFLRGAVVQREKPELVVMDPPRAGVGAEVCALLARISPAEIVYVSCDPVTLARDLKALVEAGYRLAETHMVDMFPQTFHLETVAILRK